MNRRGLILGLVVLGALCLAAYYTSHGPRGPATGGGGPAPGDKLLSFDINQVARVDETAGSNTSRVARKGGVWVTPDLFDYPADFGKVSSHLRALADEQVGQVIRGGTNYLAEFGLAAGGETEGEPPTRFVFYDAAGKKLALLALGKTQSGGRYARVDDGPVVQTKGALSGLPMAWRDWVETKLLDVSPGNVSEVRVAPTNAPAYVLMKQGTDNYSLSGLGPDETIDKAVVGKLTRALQYLSFTGLADPKMSETDLGLAKAESVTVRTADGLDYTVSLGGLADANSRYARLAVVYNKPEPPAPPEEPVASTNEVMVAEGSTATNEPSALEQAQRAYDAKLNAYNERVERLGRQAKEAAKRFSGWTFILPKQNGDMLLVKREALVKKAESAKPPEKDKPNP